MSIYWRTKPDAETRAEQELATLFKALAHPARVHIVRLLLDRDACSCGDLVDQLPLAQSTVSQHLRILKNAAVVRVETDGPQRCYRVQQDALDRLKRYVEAM